jgi:hypothetical protein
MESPRMNKIKPAKPKLKKCKVCPNRFEVWSSTTQVCSPQCAIEFARAKAAKKEKKVNREAKRKLKDEDKSFQLKKTQQLFNAFIRLRDADDSCVSCGRIHSGQHHAGHYRSVGSCPELRFCEDNCHKQCAPCNNHLSGNLIPYRVNLIGKIGLDRVEKIEGPHSPKRYTIDQLKEIQEIYKAKIKLLEKDNV